MIGVHTHPSWGELNRLADGELANARRAAAAEHVASCPRCRERMSYLADLSRAATDMRHPSPPRDLLDDIMDSRRAGRRTILPGAPVDLPRRRRLPAVAAGVAIAVTAGVATIFVASEAGAGASELTFEPAMPQAGEAVEVTYRAGSALAGEPRLRLRVRARAGSAEELRGTLGDYREVELLPQGDGRYSATLHRLDATVYEQFSVEDLSGEVVDDRSGRLWYLLSGDSDGRPLPAALLQRFRVLERRNWLSAEETLAQLTALYPERADGWSLRLAFERAARLPEERAAITAAHREIFRELQGRALAAGLVSAAEAEALARYAAALEDTDAADYWRGRLQTLDPLSRLLISVGIAERLEEEGDGLGSALDYLEEAWSSAARGPVVYESGFTLAMQSAQPEAVRRWARRVLDSTDDYEWSVDAALALVAFARSRTEGIEAVRALLDRLEQPQEHDRPLDRSREEARAEAMRLSRDLHLSLGRELSRTGAPSAALREMDRAEELGGWQPSLYRQRFEARLASGDTTGALADLARLQVDPVFSARSADSLLQRLPRRLASRLERLRDSARAEMIDGTLGDLPPARPLPSVRVRAASGASPALLELLADRPTVLALWDRRLTDAEAGAVRRADARLRETEGQILWITPEAHTEALSAFTRAERLTVPCYQDPESELAAALGEWAAHRYYVIDRSGKIRTHTHDLTEAVRLLEVLELSSRATA